MIAECRDIGSTAYVLDAHSQVVKVTIVHAVIYVNEKGSDCLYHFDPLPSQDYQFSDCRVFEKYVYDSEAQAALASVVEVAIERVNWG